MASAAIILTNIGEGGFETIEILHACIGSLRILPKLGEPFFNVGHVFPDLWTGVELVGAIALGLELSGKRFGIFAAAS